MINAVNQSALIINQFSSLICSAVSSVPELFPFDADITPLDRTALYLKSDVARFGKRMLRHMGDERSIEICPDLPVLGDDLHGIPLSGWFARPYACGVIKRKCRLVCAHGQ